MLKSDLHIHSTFSDGAHTPEEIILSAIENGLETVGFSDHSYTRFDQSYCIKKESIDEYINTINSLKEKYRDKINVLLGIEQDFYSDESTDAYDYIIGSVHYIKTDNEYISVDETAKIIIDATNKYFNGNIYDLIEKYFETVADVVDKTNADIIGHFDLISKFNEQTKLFDETDERYINAYKKACDKLLAYDKPFEINTGAISRGYKTSPYPHKDIYEYLKSKGAKFILSSDSHSKYNLCYKFSEFQNML